MPRLLTAPTAASMAAFMAVTLLVFACGSAGAASAYRPTPGSEVLWDRYGVAHVYGASVNDLFYGFGWAQARSHGDILARLYAQARGRAAEYFGAQELKNDRWMALNDVPARARQWLAQQSPEFRTHLEAFAAGINAYARAHPEALAVDARRVFPVTASDVIAHQQRLFQFVYAAPADVADRIPAYMPAPATASVTAPRGDLAAEAPAESRAEPPAKPLAEPAGSNGWAIAPSRSQDGHAMLLMNPHLYWTPGWATYDEVQLTAPGIDLYGATQVGLPVLRFVFSDYLGFTHTVNGADALTFYRVVEAPGGYRFGGRVLPYQTRRQRLKLRQPDGSFTTDTVTVRATIHGPIVGERDGAPVAMRVAGLDRPFALQQYWDMATAHDFGAFQAALARLQVPTFNILYADRDGHIEYLYNGLVPRHAFGDPHYWSGTVDGDRPDTLWREYLSYQELPKVIDPVGGTLENSNDPPWDAAWPQTLDPAPYATAIKSDSVDLRMARGIRMLSENPSISFDQLLQMKWSHRSELADRVLPDLLEASARYGDELARTAAQVLAHWDRSTGADSRGALLFLDWVDQPGAVSGYSGSGFARPFELQLPLTTPAGLADPAAAVRALEAAARDMLAHYGALDVPWGQVMRLKIGAVDVPASGGPGRLGVFDVLDFAPAVDGKRAANFGASYIAVISFDPPAHAKVLLSYGASSQPGSPHNSDQLALLSRGELRDAWTTRAQVEANLESRDRF
jgi:acyl-homoserine-lactone acylase